MVLANNRYVRNLNAMYRGQNKATNVLSFPLILPNEPFLPPPTLLLGDIYLAYETVVKEAKQHPKPLGTHLSHLVIHGVLHLLGYTHETEKQAQQMVAKEKKILSSLQLTSLDSVKR